jgi:hypothetical protein
LTISAHMPGAVSAAPGRPAQAAAVKTLNLSGYVVDTAYTQGRNTGNTFQQTYKSGTVHGVPISGPVVGTKFPVEDYVAMPIGNHEIYVTWLDPKTHALVDVFVMNFSTGKVFDYAPADFLGPPTAASVGPRSPSGRARMAPWTPRASAAPMRNVSQPPSGPAPGTHKHPPHAYMFSAGGMDGAVAR